MVTRVKSLTKRKALLDATLHLVINHGFHDAPMSKIAKMAGVSPATIYIYFKNKQDLINQLYLETKKQLSSYAFKDCHQNLPIREAFKLIWFNIAAFKLNEIEEAQFLSQCDNTPMIEEAIRKEGIKHLQPLIDLWEKGIEEGVLKNLSPYLCYAFTIYPLAFLTECRSRNYCELNDTKLEMAFEAAWDSIKINT